MNVREGVFVAEADIEANLPSETVLEDGSGFEVAVLAGSVVPCVQLDYLAGCGVLRLGQIRARGLGVDRPQSPTGFLAQVGIRLRLAYPVHPGLETVLHAELARNLAPWRVQLDGTRVWRQPDYAGLFGIGLAASF